MSQPPGLDKELVDEGGSLSETHIVGASQYVVGATKVLEVLDEPIGKRHPLRLLRHDALAILHILRTRWRQDEREVLIAKPTG